MENTRAPICFSILQDLLGFRVVASQRLKLSFYKLLEDISCSLTSPLVEEEAVLVMIMSPRTKDSVVLACQGEVLIRDDF